MIFLRNAQFSIIIESTPLVSIDLVIANGRGQILLGLRNNRPAKGYWFAPGDRVQKNERLDDAFKRLSAQELGKVIEGRQARLLDVYEHLYEDCAFGDDISTHYVVLGFHIKLQQSDLKLPKEEQHERYQWFSKSEILADPKVHENTSAYLSTL